MPQTQERTTLDLRNSSLRKTYVRKTESQLNSPSEVSLTQKDSADSLFKFCSSRRSFPRMQDGAVELQLSWDAVSRRPLSCISVHFCTSVSFLCSHQRCTLEFFLTFPLFVLRFASCLSSIQFYLHSCVMILYYLPHDVTFVSSQKNKKETVWDILKRQPWRELYFGRLET